MTTIQQMVNRLCTIINERYAGRDPESVRYFQREFSFAYPLIYWTIDQNSGRLRADFRN